MKFLIHAWERVLNCLLSLQFKMQTSQGVLCGNECQNLSNEYVDFWETIQYFFHDFIFILWRKGKEKRHNRLDVVHVRAWGLTTVWGRLRIDRSKVECSDTSTMNNLWVYCNGSVLLLISKTESCSHQRLHNKHTHTAVCKCWHNTDDLPCIFFTILSSSSTWMKMFWSEPCSGFSEMHFQGSFCSRVWLAALCREKDAIVARISGKFRETPW